MNSETELALHEQQALRAYEATIEKGLSSFIQVGNCLAIIRDSRLYRATHSTFEDYCRSRWNLGRQRAYALIDTAKVATDVSEISDVPITVESHAAALAAAPPNARPEVWKQAVQSAPRDQTGKPKVTADQVRQLAAAQHDKSPSRAGSAPPTLKTTLNDAVRALRRAVQQAEGAQGALAEVRGAVRRGLYGPEQDAQAAFREVLDVIDILLKARS